VSPAAVQPDQTPPTKPRVNPELPPQPQNTRVGKSPSLQRKSSRASDLPAASDFYAIYQQQKRRSASPSTSVTGNITPNLSSPTTGLSPSSSFSPASNSPGEGAFQRYNGERRSLRQRSASPQCRRSVEFWENKGEDHKRGRSQERVEQGNMPEKSEIKVGGGGIMERLAALQKHGEEEWRKRINNKSDSPELIIGKVQRSGVISSSSGDEEVVTLRAPKNNVRPVSLVDRLSKLNSAQNEWQKKVGEKDSEKFTVAGKMEREKIIKNKVNSDVKKEQKLTTVSEKVIPTPVIKVHEKYEESSCTKRTPKMVKFKGTSGASDSTPKSTRPVSCFVESSPSVNLLSPFVRSGSIRRVSTPENSAPKLEPISSKTVSIPQQDSQMLDSFFANELTSSTKISLNASDFDMLSTEPLLITKKAIIKPKRTKGSKNPLKSLAARTDLPESYTEVLFGVADREFKRINVEKASKHSHLAVEALAGLASTEDFTSVQLRKGVALPHQNMLPYREKMLLQVKGRRFCQSRVVAPVPESLNSGDCFILVTPTEVYNWQGKFSNVIERARSAEVALSILQKKDLGCKGASKVDTIEEEKMASCSRENRKFWKCLTGKEETGKVAEAGHADEDEDYEQQIVEASCVYEVNIETDELVPVEEGWGAPPKHEILKNSKVLVFDFGSEVYVYNGKNAPFETRKAGARLAQDLWSSGWDYSDCSINPVYGKKRDMICDSRPAWTILGRINSCMETIVFREKFLDWPDKTRVIGKRSGDKEKDDIIDVNVAPQWVWADLKGISGEELSSREPSNPDLELEGSHLGRGRGYYDEAERRQYEITTLKVTSWHVAESDSKPLAENWTGQFHTGDTYVVRWNYKVALTGRALKGGASKYSAVGRERCAYFFWQGGESRISLQGASALHTVELDSERGPQLRVKEGKEHAAFLSLWNGKMVIYKGRRGDSSTRKWRMFIVRGEDENETFLKEVDCDISSLRSRGVFLVVNNRKVIVWSGKQAMKHQASFGLAKANKLKLETPSEFSSSRLTSVETAESGRESSDFWEAVNGSSLEYNKLTRDDIDLQSTPRLFDMTSVLGTFEVTEIKPDFRKMGVINSLLFSQAILYEAEQPALFMFDCGSQLYLWQGWIPADYEAEDPESPTSVTTGSGKVRWHAERRAAMQTMLEYRKAKYGNPVPAAKLIWAGHESKEFMNYFPQWVVNQDVAKINKEFVASDDLQSTYTELSRKEYSWKELQVKPLPPGVDPARIETYLSNTLFQEKFKMSKEEYEACPRWKQIDMKKEVGLF